jgi:hypothetical protein
LEPDLIIIDSDSDSKDKDEVKITSVYLVNAQPNSSKNLVKSADEEVESGRKLNTFSSDTKKSTASLPT